MHLRKRHSVSPSSHLLRGMGPSTCTTGAADVVVKIQMPAGDRNLRYPAYIIFMTEVKRLTRY